MDTVTSHTRSQTTRPALRLVAVAFAWFAALGPAAEAQSESRHGSSRSAQPAPTMVLYDVADLVGRSDPGATPPTITSTTDPEAAREALDALNEFERARRQVRERAEGLLQVIELYVEPPFDEAHELLLAGDTTLVALATPAQHAWVESFLAAQRAFDGLVAIEARVLRAPLGTFAEAGFGPGGHLAGSRAEAEALIARLVDVGATQVTAPRLAAYPRQRASVSVQRPVSFVSDWEIHVVEPGEMRVADPVIEIAHEGMTADVRVTPLDTELLGVEVELSQTTIERPIQVQTLSLEITPVLRAEDSLEVLAELVPQTLEVAKPSLHTLSVSSTLHLADRTSALLVSEDPEQEFEIAVILIVERRTLEELAR